MKSIVLAFAVIGSTLCFSAPPRPGPFRPPPPPRRHVPPPPHRMPHHGHPHYSGFWPGFAVGVIGSTVFRPVPPPPPVVVTPAPVVVQPTQVWVNGYWRNDVQPNGTIVRVWVPGHWEIR